MKCWAQLWLRTKAYSISFYSDQIEMDQETKWIIIKIIRELQAEVKFYQNIIKESFLDDSNY